MINIYEVNETNKMVEQENLDVRTITMGISLLDCCDENLEKLNEKIYEKITRLAKNLVSTGEVISKEFGIPIVNKRISVTPIALVGGSACHSPEDFVTIAQTLDRAAKKVGVNFLGGYSALVSKGMTQADRNLILSIPKALATDGARVQLRECRLHEDRSGYGCDQTDGRDREADSGGDEGTGFSRMRQAGGILQRSGR